MRSPTLAVFHSARGWRDEELQTLRQTILFRGLEDTALRDLPEAATWCSCRRGEVIVDPDGHHRCAYLIAHGHADLTRLSPRGDEAMVMELYTGDPYGVDPDELPLDLWNYLKVMTDGTLVWRMLHTYVSRVCLSRLEVVEEVLHLTTRRVVALQDRIEARRAERMPVRLARLLADEARTNEEHLVTRTHVELAADLDVGARQVSRALRTFRKWDLIWSHPYRSGITVPDPDHLVAEVIRLQSA